MKIRSGFVSNSSSSSFVVVGKKLDIRDINFKMIKEKCIIAMGGELSDGDDVFQIQTPEELAFLKALDNLESDYYFTFIEAYVYNVDDMEGEIDAEKLPKTGKIKFYSGFQDQNSSECLDDLKRRYDPDGNATKVMQRYLRAKKINKLEKTNKT